MKLLTLAALLACSLPLPAFAVPEAFIEGHDYTTLDTPQRTHVPAGKVEVLEVFSYGCPFCNQFQPVIQKIRQTLPANAQFVLLPASFSPADDMPMFQRAFFTAQFLNILERTHEPIFDAVWESGEIAVIDSETHRAKVPAPTLEDVARVYARLTGIKAEDFLKAAHSPEVETRMRDADAEIMAMQIPGTPALVVNGKYRVEMDAMRNADEVVSVVQFLVIKASAR